MQIIALVSLYLVSIAGRTSVTRAHAGPPTRPTATRPRHTAHGLACSPGVSASVWCQQTHVCTPALPAVTPCPATQQRALLGETLRVVYWILRLPPSASHGAARVTRCIRVLGLARKLFVAVSCHQYFLRHLHGTVTTTDIRRFQVAVRRAIWLLPACTLASPSAEA